MVRCRFALSIPRRDCARSSTNLSKSSGRVGPEPYAPCFAQKLEKSDDSIMSESGAFGGGGGWGVRIGGGVSRWVVVMGGLVGVREGG